MNVTEHPARAIVKQHIHRLKSELGQVRFKRRYARGWNRRLAKRNETQLRKALEIAHKHFSDDVQTLQEA